MSGIYISSKSYSDWSSGYKILHSSIPVYNYKYYIFVPSATFVCQKVQGTEVTYHWCCNNFIELKFKNN